MTTLEDWFVSKLSTEPELGTLIEKWFEDSNVEYVLQHAIVSNQDETEKVYRVYPSNDFDVAFERECTGRTRTEALAKLLLELAKI